MKKTLVLFLSLLLVAGFVLFSGVKKENKTSKKGTLSALSPTQASSGKQPKQSIFIPYWSISVGTQDFGDYDQLIYFGIMATQSGINTEDAGYRRLADFVNLTGDGKTTLLTLRMLDSKNNFAILKNTQAQNAIIKETITIAKANGFDGIVLDLELQALPFDSLIQQVNAFNKKFFDAAKAESLTYSITMYGDVYYRVRPYDVKTLANSADQIMIMAYDLHKAGGNPGPNFPLAGGETYGYDYKRMIDRFISEVPAEKLMVIFGLYGYDWQVDEKNISQKIGKPLSYSEIKNSILENCEAVQCAIKRDELSQETVVTYIAADGAKHTVWHEDMLSAAKKQEYLQERGINNFSFWANGYF